MKVIYTLQPGESYKFWNGMIVVAHPEHPPKIVHADGTTEIITAVEDAKDPLKAAQTAFETIRDFSDSEMADGDAARIVAKAWLATYARR
jgi:hypothetical protein